MSRLVLTKIDLASDKFFPRDVLKSWMTTGSRYSWFQDFGLARQICVTFFSGHESVFNFHFAHKTCNTNPRLRTRSPFFAQQPTPVVFFEPGANGIEGHERGESSAERFRIDCNQRSYHHLGLRSIGGVVHQDAADSDKRRRSGCRAGCSFRAGGSHPRRTLPANSGKRRLPNNHVSHPGVLSQVRCSASVVHM